MGVISGGDCASINGGDIFNSRMMVAHEGHTIMLVHYKTVYYHDIGSSNGQTLPFRHSPTKLYN